MDFRYLNLIDEDEEFLAAKQVVAGRPQGPFDPTPDTPTCMVPGG